MTTIAHELPHASGVHTALRRGCISTPGRSYFVTAVTFRREPRFADFERACRIAPLMSDSRIWRDSRVFAWVLMPDRLHLLLGLGSSDTLDTVIGRFKAVSSSRLRSATDRSTAIWSRGFHNRAIRHDQNLVDAARRLVANPLRAGLVDRLGDYPFWNAVWLEPGDGSPV